MINWYWLPLIIGGSLLVGLIVGYFRIFWWHYKITGKWIGEEKEDIVNSEYKRIENMLKLTQKGKQLYEEVRELYETDIETMRLLYFLEFGTGDTKALARLVTIRKESLEFLESKGLIEGE